MKKIFFLAATMVAAMAMNAASFTGFDAFDGALGDRIEGMVTDLTNASMALTEAGTPGKYSIFAETAGVEGSFKIGGVKFAYTDSSNPHKEIVKTYGTYIQPNGARRVITIPTVPGEKVKIYVTADVAVGDGEIVGAQESITSFPAYGEGKSVYTELTATDFAIVITMANKAKYAAILPSSATGFNEVAAEKANVQRVMMNGRVYLRKADGKLVNMLGF